MNLSINEDFPVSDKLYSQGLYLPSGIGLNENQIKKVCNIFHKIINETKNKPLRVAIVFESDIHSGGAFQQSMSTIELLEKLPKDLIKIKFYRTFNHLSSESSLQKLQFKIIKLNVLKILKLDILEKNKNLKLLK